MRTAILAGLAVLLLGAASPSWGSTTSNAPTQDDPRFDLTALQGICSDVRGGNSRYEEKVLLAARVMPGATDEQRRANVGSLFATHMPMCSGYNLHPGNILKFAVAARNYDFLYTAANVWRVDLNVADTSDGRNVLDYLEVELSKNLGKPIEAELTSYRDMLIRAGARTTAQLEAGEDCRPSTRCRR